MKHTSRHLRSLLLAFAALALSAGLAFAATPPAASWGLANAASHAGQTVPVAGADDVVLGEDDEVGDEQVEEDSEGDETEDVEGSEEAGENCATDPTLLTEEELATMRHGSLVCWAAHQATWPEWFAGHGEWVRCWAHHGKADWASCTEDPAAEAADGDETGDGDVDDAAAEDAAATVRGNGKGSAKGASQGKTRHR